MFEDQVRPWRFVEDPRLAAFVVRQSVTASRVQVLDVYRVAAGTDVDRRFLGY